MPSQAFSCSNTHLGPSSKQFLGMQLESWRWTLSLYQMVKYAAGPNCCSLSLRCTQVGDRGPQIKINGCMCQHQHFRHNLQKLTKLRQGTTWLTIQHSLSIPFLCNWLGGKERERGRKEGLNVIANVFQVHCSPQKQELIVQSLSTVSCERRESGVNNSATKESRPFWL